MNCRFESVSVQDAVLDVWPAVIGPCDTAIDFFKLATNIIDQNLAVGLVDRKGKRIAIAGAPDGLVFPGRPVQQRVVSGDRAVFVDPQDFALECVEILRRQPSCLFADSNVKFTIDSEVQRAPLVAGRYFAAKL